MQVNQCWPGCRKDTGAMPNIVPFHKAVRIRSQDAALHLIVQSVTVGMRDSTPQCMTESLSQERSCTGWIRLVMVVSFVSRRKRVLQLVGRFFIPSQPSSTRNLFSPRSAFKTSPSAMAKRRDRHLEYRADAGQQRLVLAQLLEQQRQRKRTSARSGQPQTP